MFNADRMFVLAQAFNNFSNEICKLHMKYLCVIINYGKIYVV